MTLDIPVKDSFITLKIDFLFMAEDLPQLWQGQKVIQIAYWFYHNFLLKQKYFITFLLHITFLKTSPYTKEIDNWQ